MKFNLKKTLIVSVYLMAGAWIAYTFSRTSKTDEVVFSIGAGTEEIRFVKKLIERFEGENPATKVALNVLPAPTDQQHHYYLTTLGAKSPDIDVVRIDTIWIAEFASAGWLEPLDDYITAENRASFIPILEKIDVGDNDLYALPWDANIGLLYYRKDLLEKYREKPPDTWEELISICKKISRSEHIYGYLWQGKQYEGLVCNFLEFIGSNNGGIIDADGNVIINSPHNKKILDFMHDVIWKHRISPPNTHSELMEESSRHLFQQGKGIFLRNWTYVWDLCQKDPFLKNNVGVSPLPKFVRESSVYGGWHLAINAYSKKKEKAWQLIEFLTSHETQRELAMNLSWAPTKSLLYKDPEILQQLPFLPVVERSLEGVHMRPTLPYYPWISDILQKHISRVLSGQTSSQEALEDMQKRLVEVHNEFSRK